jgi:hypothetical protein
MKPLHTILSIALILLSTTLSTTSADLALNRTYLTQNGYQASTMFISLRGLSIVSIDPLTFNGFTFLLTLDLANNKLTYIDPAIFNGL